MLSLIRRGSALWSWAASGGCAAAVGGASRGRRGLCMLVCGAVGLVWVGWLRLWLFLLVVEVRGGAVKMP
ncbi:hypothetical protein [Pyrobaculum sp.]|uniref:hypothetical protein n=1 Tax=Pyrobaculum sp. TaxID=2004705 RepID=UPI00317D93E1